MAPVRLRRSYDASPAEDPGLVVANYVRIQGSVAANAGLQGRRSIPRASDTEQEGVTLLICRRAGFSPALHDTGVSNPS